MYLCTQNIVDIKTVILIVNSIYAMLSPWSRLEKQDFNLFFQVKQLWRPEFQIRASIC